MPTNILLDNNTIPLAPTVYGLVLVGGHSKRMGRDKGRIQLKNKDIRLHIYDLLTPLVTKCFFSGRANQIEELIEFPFIKDKITAHGPIGALLTAFEHTPDVAWLIVGCDFPFIKEATFQQLLSQRDPNKLATAFSNSDIKLPNPMPAIWEPIARQSLTNALENGNDSLMKTLLKSDTNILIPDEKKWLFNMNKPEDIPKQ